MVTSRPADQRVAVDQSELMDALVTTSFQTMAVLTRIAAEHDLSLTQLRVLAILRDRRVRMAALANYLGLDKSTVTGLVDRAQMRGLLTRSQSEDDGRVVEVSLSSAGQELAVALHGQVARSLEPMITRLTSAERRCLRSSLDHMLGAYEPS